MNVKHTPGPWKITVGFDRSTISGGTSESGSAHVIAEVRHPTAFRAGEGQANARLINTAPELLKALKWAMKQGNLGYAARTKGNTAYCDAVDRAVAVIARAEDNG